MSGDAINLPGRFAVYGASNGKPAVVARFEDNDVWLTQKQLADLFNTTKQLVSHHIRQIIESGELAQSRTVKKYLTVQTEGTRTIGRHVAHYNLDMIIALGYRIDSPISREHSLRQRADFSRRSNKQGRAGIHDLQAARDASTEI